MAKKSPPRAPGPCDICGATPAPFGFQPPGGARALKPGTRPLRACPKICCRFKANARLAAHAKPGAKARRMAPPAPRTPRPDPAQGSLL